MYGVTREENARPVAAIDYVNVLSVTATERDVREACD